MKIFARRVQLPLRHTFRIARQSEDVSENFYVEIKHLGINAIGEGAPSPRYGEDVPHALVALERVTLHVNSAFTSVPDTLNQASAALEGMASAKAGLDLALYDLLGKMRDVPVHQLLGINASKTPITSFTLGIDTVEKTRAKVREAEEYPILKVKLGADNDYEIIETIRDLTEKPIRVDANEGWEREEALQKIRWLEKRDIELVEQPLHADDLEGMEWLRSKVHLPLFADESCRFSTDIPGLVGRFDGINIKLNKCGGITEALHMINLARSHGLKIMLGCMIESSVGITAAAHLASLVDYLDLDGHLLLARDPYEGVTTDKGEVRLPNEPGLGVRPRQEHDEKERHPHS